MKNRDIAAILIFIGIVFIFFYKTLIFGLLPVPSDDLVGLYHPYRDFKASEYPNGIPYKNFLITDPIRQQIPWRKLVIDSYKNGTLPKWDATSFSGTPLLANIQSGAFYPLNILFFIFPFHIAWTMLIISQTLLSGIFFYIFMRVLSLGPIPSLFGAVIFSFSGTSIAWLTWGTILSAWMWTPLILSSVHKLLTHDKRRAWVWEIIAVFSIVSSFFAGHLQVFFYSSVLSVSYAAWLTVGYKKIHWIKPIVGIALAVFAIIFYQLNVVLKWLPSTSRITGGSAWHSEGFFIPLQHLAQFIAPDFFGNPATLNYWGVWNYGEMVGYIGIAGLVFALLGISRQTMFWLAIATISLLFAIESPISALPYVLHIPFLSSLQPTRLLIIVDLALSVFAAHGLSKFLTSHKRNYTPIVIIGGLLALLWGIFVLHGAFGITLQNAQVIKRNLFVPTILYIGVSGLFVMFQFLKGRVARVTVVFIFIMFAIFDLIRFGWKFTPFTDQELFFPRTKVLSYLENAPRPFRMMTLDDRILPPDTNTYYGIESVNGYDPIHSLRYDQFISAMERGEPNINPPYGYERIIVPKNINSPLFNLLGVRYIVSFNELMDKRFKKVLTEGQTNVYENQSMLPRAYLVSNAIYKQTDQEIINTLYSKTFNFQFDAVVETSIDILNTELQVGESATITRYEPEKMTISVKTTQPRLLVIGNMYNPNWKATIDGKLATLIRTNYLFIGVVVPVGIRKVTVTYK